MASRRRRNLQTGLQQLHARREQAHTRNIEAAKRKLAAREAALSAPIPQDEALTRVSQPLAHTANFQRGAPAVDPSKSSLEARQARIAAVNAAKSESRKGALTKLYHSIVENPEEFIVDEKELDAVIDRVFAPRPKEWNSHGEGANVWNTGSPDGITAKLQAMYAMRRRADSSQAYNDIGGGEKNVRRVQTLAEELLGAPLSNEKSKEDTW
jgi:hypothetical protein